MSKKINLGPVTAYAIAVANGFTGTVKEWLESLRGEPGPKGDPGEKGEPGQQGYPGPAGVGVPDGGTDGQFLGKTADGTAWVDPPQSGLPSGGAPYQQLVTDGNGNTQWEDRLAYDFIVDDVDFFQEENIAFGGETIRQSPFGELVIGHKYTVVWDGVTYPDLVAFDDYGNTTIGSPYDSITEDLPFCIATFHIGSEDEVSIEFSAYQDNTTHSVYISGPAKLASKIKQKYLPEIGLNIVLTLGSDKSISSNVTYEQVADAFNNKKPIRFFIYNPSGTCFETVCARMEKMESSGQFVFYLTSFDTTTAKTSILNFFLNIVGKWSVSSNTIVEDAT